MNSKTRTWLVLVIASSNILLFALTVPATGKQILPSNPYKNKEVARNMFNWLGLAYSESEEFAGFGPLLEKARTEIDLYTTFGAVYSLHYLEEDIRKPQLIGEHINSLLTDRGAYDCPRNNAPLLYETYWAVATLEVIGVPPQVPERTAAFLLSLQTDDGLFRFDQKLETPSLATLLAVKTLQKLGGKRIPSVKTPLNRAETGVSKVVEELAQGNWRAFDTTKTNRLLNALYVLALLNSEAVPQEGKTVLDYYLEKIPHRSVSLSDAKGVNNILDMAKAVDLITPSEVQNLSGLKSYLDQLRSSPETSKLGGYSHYCRWAGRVDPTVTWDSVRLFARVGRPYPGRDELVESLDKYRIEKGWITGTVPCPNVDDTYYGFRVAQTIGWEDYNSEKMVAYAQSVLRDPATKDVHDLYWAARLMVALGENKERVKSVLKNSLANVSKGCLKNQIRSLVSLLEEFNLTFSSSINRLLHKEAKDLTDILTSREWWIEHVHRLALIQKILDQRLLPPDRLEEMIWTLQTDERGGGFKPHRLASSPSLTSTYRALKTLKVLGALGKLSAEDVEDLRSYIHSCQTGYGFTWGAPEKSSESTLHSNFLGIDTLQLLDSLQNRSR